METIQKYYRIDRREICYLKFILEGYEGMALMSTVDPDRGLVVLKIAPGCETEADELMRALRQEIMIEACLEPKGLETKSG